MSTIPLRVRRVAGPLLTLGLALSGVLTGGVRSAAAADDAAVPAVPVPAKAAKTVAVPDVATLTAETRLALAPVGVHKILHLAVYKGPGTSDSRSPLIDALKKDGNVVTEDMTPEQIRAGKLTREQFDGFVVPGGESYVQGVALGEDGRELVRQFVHGGGSYLGVCAGSYLAADSFAWSLHIMNSRVKDYDHWARGHGPVEIAPTAEGKKMLGTSAGTIPIIYWQGPLLEPRPGSQLPAYTEWAKYSSDIATVAVTNRAPKGMMPGATAVAASDFGAGRVVCFSPHPEKTPGEETLFHHALLWMTRTEETPKAAAPIVAATVPATPSAPAAKTK